MAAFDLTSRPFEGSLSDQAERLSKEAVSSKKDKCLETRTRSWGHLTLIFKPTGRVEITFRDRGGLKEGWFMKDWTIATTLRRFNELINS